MVLYEFCPPYCKWGLRRCLKNDCQRLVGKSQKASPKDVGRLETVMARWGKEEQYQWQERISGPTAFNYPKKIFSLQTLQDVKLQVLVLEIWGCNAVQIRLEVFNAVTRVVTRISARKMFNHSRKLRLLGFFQSFKNF